MQTRLGFEARVTASRRVARRAWRQARSAAKGGAEPVRCTGGWRRTRVSGRHFRERREGSRWVAERDQNQGADRAPAVEQGLPT